VHGIHNVVRNREASVQSDFNDLNRTVAQTYLGNFKGAGLYN